MLLQTYNNLLAHGYVYTYLIARPLAECAAVYPLSWRMRILRHRGEPPMLLLMVICGGKERKDR